AWPLLPIAPDSSTPPSLELSLQQVIHHGTYAHPHLFLRQEFTAEKRHELETRVAPTSSDSQSPLELSRLTVKSRSAVRVPYPEANLVAFQQYIASYDSAWSVPETSVFGWDYQTAVTNLSVRHLPFRYHYHAYGAQATRSFWQNPLATWVAAGGLPPLKAPDVADNDTVVALAKMCANAYSLPSDDGWYDLHKQEWHNATSFGWDSDGVRGYIYTDDSNSTVVVAIKGTSARFFLGGDSDTSARDKVNDNRLFSCCCARVDYSWSTVCDCYQGGGKCDQQCLEDSLDQDDLYFQAVSNFFLYVNDIYPNADIWFTGHSLGGSVAGLIGHTFGHPVVAFQSPGELLAASRLHLPLGPAVDMNQVPIWHFGNNADPIFMGTCTGATSSCYYGGYALESRCHLGQTCVIDMVKHKGWSVDIRNHRIAKVIDGVLIDDSVPWPNCTADLTCTDCAKWSFE
ncbi:putative lipase atg15, partial [Dispira parvispora]